VFSPEIKGFEVKTPQRCKFQSNFYRISTEFLKTFKSKYLYNFKHIKMLCVFLQKLVDSTLRSYDGKMKCMDASRFFYLPLACVINFFPHILCLNHLIGT